MLFIDRAGSERGEEWSKEREGSHLRKLKRKNFGEEFWIFKVKFSKVLRK